MKHVLLLVLLGLTTLAAACGTYGAGAAARAPKPGASPAADEVANGLVGEPSANPTAGAFHDDGTDGDVRARTEHSFAKEGKDTGVTPAPRDRLLIQRGEIRVEVARPEDVARDFLAKVTEWGGYLQHQVGATLTVRLPATKFDEAFAAVRALGRVLAESRQADDVTEEFVDLGIRLDTAKKARDRLLDVLQKAEKIEDILKVEAELRRLTEEIERMEGRRKFLADQVALATLRVTFQATASAPPPPPRSRQRSRFEWINRVGAESMMGDF